MDRKNFRTINNPNILIMIFKVVINEIKNLKQIYNIPGNGYFAVDEQHPKALIWQNCREKFLANFFCESKGLFFTHYSNSNEDIASFIVKCEKILQDTTGQNNIEHTSFKKTSNEKIIWVQPSNFWLGCLIKRSLLTLLLRCALNYKVIDDNFDACLFCNKYEENKLARETKNAITRFFHGFTEYKGTHYLAEKLENDSIITQGWHFEFKDRSLCYLKQVLQKPLRHSQKNLTGIDALWN